MKFLIDNMLSVQLGDALTELGHDATHVRNLGLGSVPDYELLEWAKHHELVVLSADRDFGTLLAELKTDSPSVVYLRGNLPRNPNRLAQLIELNLPAITQSLIDGAIVVIEPGRIRVRNLPIKE
jgi:predicted nuclease of predicted toxin-antitoxin system